MAGRKEILTTEELIADLRRVAKVLGHAPRVREYRLHGRFDSDNLRRRLGGTWRLAVEQGAKLCYGRNVGHPVPTDAELRRDLERVASVLGHPPSYSDYERMGRYNVETVKRRAGRRRWYEAVAALSGWDEEHVRSHQGLRLRYQTREILLGRLREMARELGRAPTTREALVLGMSPSWVRRRVGAWGEALREAGVG